MAELRIETVEGFALATVMARKGIAAEAICHALGIEVPAACASQTNSAGLSLISTGPGTWLAYQAKRDPTWIPGLQERLSGLASVSDQSGGYTMLRLSGPAARTLLQRGVAIDLHPEAFGPGSAANTLIAHIGVLLWQLDAVPTYQLAVFRSYSESFSHWLHTAAAAV